MHTIQRRESLVGVAKQAGMVVPDDPYLDGDYPYWRLFCTVQLDRPINSENDLLHNAVIIAAIPDDRIYSVQFSDISSLLM